MKELLLITGNQHKVREFSRMLNMPVKAQKIELPEIQDTDIATVARIKAEHAYAQVQQPLVVDDSGFCVNAWGNLPGALAFWFFDNLGPEGLVTMLNGFDDRSAYAETVLSYCDERGSHVFKGRIQGEIATEPRGTTGGFGYDVLFIPEGSDKTFAEMTDEEKDAISPRRLAIDQLHEFLISSETK